MSSLWIGVTARPRTVDPLVDVEGERVRPRPHTTRGSGITLCTWLCLSAFAASFAGCGTPEKGGPRRTASDDEDAGEIGPRSCAELTCEAPGVCMEELVRGVSRAACTCPTGYKVDGTRCADVDECARAEDNNCDANATCENSVGSFRCRCKAGFGLEGNTCKNLDSCVGVANTCHPSAACLLADGGGISCSCGAGFEGDGKACIDVDECENGSAKCAENAHCTNTRDGYSCACDTLYTGDGQVQCRDRCDAAEADPARCDASGRGLCSVGPNGVAVCAACASDSLGDGRRCTQNSECAALNCGKNTVCSGSAGARTCACAPGYTGDPIAGCVDANECTSQEGTMCNPDTSRCVNTPGSYVCECKQGFERSGDECVDIKECERGLDRCDPNATCIEKTPGYSCECKPGFELQPDGLSCADIDECENGSAKCRMGDNSVMCVNTRGSYECRCPKGYAGDGTNEACYCDLSGWWGSRQDATLIFPARSAAGQVLVAKSITYASIWELFKYRYDGNKIVVERRSCGSDVAPEIYSPLYNETYSSSTPNSVFDQLKLVPARDIPLPKAQALPGMTFNTPKDAIVNGVKLDDPLNDEWPAKSTDIPANRWVDTEDDGQLGLSIWPNGTTLPTMRGMGETYSYLPVALEEGTSIISRRLGCASIAIRTTGSNRVNIDSCDVLTGNTLETHAEGRVHSCTVLREADWETTDITCTSRDWKDARPCTPEEVEFLDSQDQNNMVSATFEMQKMGGLDGPDVDCPAVRAKLPAIVRSK